MRRCVLLLLLAGVVGPFVWSASAQPVPIGNANFVEWDVPAPGGAASGALEVFPLTGGTRAVFYVTRGPTPTPSLIRFNPGSPIATATATWQSWALNEATTTGGLKLRPPEGANQTVFIRDSLSIGRLNTGSSGNNFTRWLDPPVQSISDLAMDIPTGTGSANIYTTGPSGTGGTLQRLIPGGGTSATVTRWPVGGGAGREYLSGVATRRTSTTQVRVYWSEPTSNMIGELVNPAVGANTAKRWSLTATGASGPRQLEVDANGDVWVVTASGHVVRLDPLTNEVTPYLIPTPGSSPIGVGPDGVIGFTENATKKVGMLIPDGTTLVVPPTTGPVTGTSTTLVATQVPRPATSGNAAPVAKTGPATTTGTSATGIFVEALLPDVSASPIAIERDPAGPAGPTTGTFFYSVSLPLLNRIGWVTLTSPPVPTTLTLSPPTGTNPAGTPHTVTATVRDQFGDPLPGVTVRFSVSGTHSDSGSDVTDVNGEATFTYTGTAVGPDTISAYADTDGNSTQDTGEPSGAATKVWTPGAPASVTLYPPTATNTVGTQHCVTATVRDAFGNPVPNVTVYFSVTGVSSASDSATTDENGQATFCYTGPTVPGADTITAYADTDNNTTQDPGEPMGGATKVWTPAAPATLTLSPALAINPVGTEHCVTATVRDVFGNPVPNVTVRFSVTGVNGPRASASATNANGQATFCYTGTVLGLDTIDAYADTDNDTMPEAGEPAGTAFKLWTRPTRGCPDNGGDDDEDDDGLEDKDESLLGTLIGVADSDGDGRKDGNDDSDDDGEDDEDEDDDSDDECPNDSDGDGEDDEDEDDDDDDDDD